MHMYYMHVSFNVSLNHVDAHNRMLLLNDNNNLMFAYPQMVKQQIWKCPPPPFPPPLPVSWAVSPPLHSVLFILLITSSSSTFTSFFTYASFSSSFSISSSFSYTTSSSTFKRSA